MRHLPLRLCIALLLSTSVCAWAGTIFKCKNADGALQYQEKPCAKEVQSISSWADTSASTQIDSDSANSDNQPLILGQGAGGHYYIDGSVNDSFLHFVIDTGATMVALPATVASSAHLKCKQAVMVSTANGQSQGCVTTIEKLKIGNFTLHYVDAVLQPNLGQPLLGMNVLKQFRVEQDNGQMRLSRKY